MFFYKFVLLKYTEHLLRRIIKSIHPFISLIECNRF